MSNATETDTETNRDAPVSDPIRVDLVCRAARTAYADAGKDMRAAAVLLRQRMDEDQALRDALLEPMIDRAIWCAMRHCVQAIRRDFGQASAPLRSVNPDNTIGIKAVAKRSWYDYPLPGGILLGDARAIDLSAAINEHDRNARTNAAKAKWLRVVVDRVRPHGDKRVRDVISEAALAKIAEAGHE